MKRNWYAIFILLVLALSLAGGGVYVRESTRQLYDGVQQALSCAKLQDYDAALRAYAALNSMAQQKSAGLNLFLRRNLVDQMTQTLATLSDYVSPDNEADLAVESARACAQLKQLKASYFSIP